MNNYADHAKREFAALGYKPDDEGPNRWIQDNLLELLSMFEKQGHSGASAPYCAEAFRKLALFEPLSPINGTPDEWVEVGEGTFQNARCSHVFKEGKDGEAYDIEGIIFREPNGSCYTSRDSRVNVTFPYVPARKYVDRPA